MIQAEVVLDGGLLKSCRVQGHAGSGPKGSDIVCAAVSVLSRTVLRTLSRREGITVRSEAPERGILLLEAEGIGGSREFLAAAGAFLCEGLLSVAEEYPEFCQVTIERRN
ncbi:ribosomal-processing cysteine protease Prp [Leadbettera azotonutricia]|uniref:Ribosomal processing cysteine protease Prp n=1 Tax=Leadbettera azotonutricia (strain ATCC BAA-888 / DSM 13862 / ZAS-9) TaxID=545695 RepID=F5Y7D8_LEAAZ|nr:ribosomal-processing cysteine protease Prp [Leadbettera azotonutricia]AEF82342.1 conserved hypothetical protein [Leadbettera azotonutricia ZAS-9]